MASRGHSIQKDAVNSFDAKLDSVLTDKNWLWNPAWSEELVSIQHKLSLINIRDEDSNLVSYKIWQVCLCCHWEELRTKSIRRKFHGGT
jgi:hypothetical protein